MRLLEAPRKIGSLFSKLKKQDGGRELFQILNNKLGIGATSARQVSRRAKIAASPFKARNRFRMQGFNPSNDLIVPRDKGWLKISADSLVGTDDIVSHCRSLFEAKKEKLLKEFEPPYAPVLTLGNDLTISDPEEYRPLLQFCTQKPLFDAICTYVGEWPVISSVGLVYTPANSDMGKATSQHFHRDMNHFRQLHLIMPITPVDMEAGPFTFLPGDASLDAIKANKHDGGRLTDEQALSDVDEDKLIFATGNPGEVYLVDPYACIHCGARTKSKSRLALIINFTSLFEASEGLRSLCRAPNRHLLADGKHETELLLNLR